MILLAQLAAPQLFAFEIAGNESRRAQPGVHALAIRHWRGRALWIGRVCPVRSRMLESGLPQRFSAGAIETRQRAAVLLLDRLSEVYAIPPENGCGIAPFDERNPP